MRLIKLIHAGEFRTIAKFVVYGAVNVGVSWGLYLLLLMVFGYLTAYFLSFISGIAIALILNSKFVFKTSLTLRKASGFVAAYIIQFLAGIIILQFLVEQAIVSSAIAPLGVMVFTVPLSFLMSRYALRRL